MRTTVPAQISAQLTKELSAWIASPETPYMVPTASHVVAKVEEYHDVQEGPAVEVVTVGGVVTGVPDGMQS